MSRRVLLATSRKHPEPTASDALLAAQLRSRGVDVMASPWDDVTASTLGGTVVCLRSTWDYHRRSDEFRSWIMALAAHDVRLINPAATVLWNMDKEYLGWLAARGIAMPATHWVAPGDPVELPRLLAAAGWQRAVLKPRISATAWGTHLVTASSTLDDAERERLSRAGALLQAFVPEIQSAGETSLIFIDGGFSHAVIKRPSPGDFRVQHEFGGTAEATIAAAPLREFGSRVLAAVPGPWSYARVDVVDTAAGPLLMELELIEPDLFLGLGGDGAERLADVLAAMT